MLERIQTRHRIFTEEVDLKYRFRMWKVQSLKIGLPRIMASVFPRGFTVQFSYIETCVNDVSQLEDAECVKEGTRTHLSQVT